MKKMLKKREKLAEVLKQPSQKSSVKKGVLKNFAKLTGKHLCPSFFIKKETLVQVFSYEFCEILRTLIFIEHLCWLLLEVSRTIQKVSLIHS